MDMSLTTTSGRRLFAFSTASKPPPASPHTTQSRRDDRRRRTPRLTVSWSSTIRMRNEPMPYSPKPTNSDRYNDNYADPMVQNTLDRGLRSLTENAYASNTAHA